MKHKYVELDGLRGVAALGVVLLHLSNGFDPRYASLFQRHFYLAVDFFMLLSGFVIAHAYEERLREPKNRVTFLRDRVIRLHPMLIFAAVLGTLTICIGARAGDHRSYPPATLALYLVTGVIPMPLPGAAWAFPVNFPLWSLFWELLLNIAFAFAAPYLKTGRLVTAILVCALAMLIVSRSHGTVDVGARWPGVFAVGPRMLTGFLLGILLLRIHRAGILAGGGRRWWLAPVLVGTFVLMHSYQANSVKYDLLAVLAIFPILVLAAAGSKPVVPAIAQVSGQISYPLYVLHAPLAGILAYGAHRGGLAPGLAQNGVVLSLTLILSYATYRFYDEPIRRALRRRYGSPSHRQPDPEPVLSAA